ncbi:MAG: DUF4440 domain-containing protein [Pseudomonadales bacterium]
MKISIFVLSCAVFLGACNQQPSTAATSLGSPNTAKFMALLNAKDVDGLVNIYTDDARVMPPNGKMKQGEAAVLEEFRAMIDAGITGTLTSIESKALGNIAYNLGTYELQIEGETIDTGKWVETWQRGDDGVWRISIDIWNSDNPAVPAASPVMTHMLGTHRVNDSAKWLAAWRGEDGRRKLFAANGAPHVHVMQIPDDSNITGLFLGLSDPAAFEAWLNSDEGQAAAAEDSVDYEYA